MIGSAAGMVDDEIQYWIASFNGCSGGVQLQSVQDLVKHKVNENAAIILCTAGIDRPIIFRLVVMHHRFNRKILKYRIQLGQNQRLP